MRDCVIERDVTREECLEFCKDSGRQHVGYRHNISCISTKDFALAQTCSCVLKGHIKTRKIHYKYV